MPFSNKDDIIKSYNFLYCDILYDNSHLVDIFNENYDLNIIDNIKNPTANEIGLFLNLGHYYALKKRRY